LAMESSSVIVGIIVTRPVDRKPSRNAHAQSGVCSAKTLVEANMLAPLVTSYIPATPHPEIVWGNGVVVAVARAAIPDTTEFEHPQPAESAAHLVRFVRTGDVLEDVHRLVHVFIQMRTPIRPVIEHQCEEVVHSLPVTEMDPPVCCQHVPVARANSLHAYAYLVGRRQQILVEVDSHDYFWLRAFTRNDALLLMGANRAQPWQSLPRLHPWRLPVDADRAVR